MLLDGPRSSPRHLFRGRLHTEGGHTLAEFLGDVPSSAREAAIAALEHANKLVIAHARSILPVEAHGFSRAKNDHSRGESCAQPDPQHLFAFPLTASCRNSSRFVVNKKVQRYYALN